MLLSPGGLLLSVSVSTRGRQDLDLLLVVYHRSLEIVNWTAE